MIKIYNKKNQIKYKNKLVKKQTIKYKKCHLKKTKNLAAKAHKAARIVLQFKNSLLRNCNHKSLF
jgi:hypothetical protein